ncbi:MAG TPA: biosynthetic-type acetolactate synthase large subunit, partial [Dehalococcoidales bacterium]|nr:biosynthetic-type acetolactate synthase large subunit [Dehalococcoidales bacterium]
VIKEAFYLARTGRPGPVLIDIPKDVFTEKAEYNYPASVELPGYNPNLSGHPAQIKKAAEMINNACKKPLIIAGRGVIVSGAFDELKQLVETTRIPVLTTLLGIGSFPESHALSYGMIGMHGMVYANWAVNAADLIIAIGMRMDDRATSRFADFAPNARIIHIDIDPAEIGKNVRVDVPIVGDIKKILTPLLKLIKPAEHLDWIHQLDHWRKDHPIVTNRIRNAKNLLPQFVVRKIYEVTKGEALIVAGVGQNQMWAAQHYWFDKPNSFITSGGLGTMGFELPASMGVKVGRPNDIVWCICGDGGFQMTMHELGTIMQEKLGVKIAILNNGFLGMVRQWQDLFYEKRYVATPLVNPDFVKMAEAYEIPALRVEHKIDVIPAIEKAMATEGPFLIDFRVEPEENVYPMVPSGESLSKVIEEPQKEVQAWSQQNTP